MNLEEIQTKFIYKLKRRRTNKYLYLGTNQSKKFSIAFTELSFSVSFHSLAFLWEAFLQKRTSFRLSWILC